MQFVYVRVETINFIIEITISVRNKLTVEKKIV